VAEVNRLSAWSTELHTLVAEKEKAALALVSNAIETTVTTARDAAGREVERLSTELLETLTPCLALLESARGLHRIDIPLVVRQWAACPPSCRPCPTAVLPPPTLDPKPLPCGDPSGQTGPPPGVYS